jgi:hypothetical protein
MTLEGPATRERSWSAVSDRGLFRDRLGRLDTKAGARPGD